MADLAHVLRWAQGEAELVTELQGGSGTAFDWLVTHYYAAVYSLVLGMLGNSADAADVTQEVFLKAFRGIRGFRRGSSLKTWLYRIAVREALNQRRWWWRHHRQQTSIDAETRDEQAAVDLEDLGATPFDQLAARELEAVVHRALRDVPEVFRSAVILRDLEGLSYEEVAEVLDVSVGTVKSRILRGRRALREILEPLLSAERQPAVPGRRPATGSGRRTLAPDAATAPRCSFGRSDDAAPDSVFGVGGAPGRMARSIGRYAAARSRRVPIEVRFSREGVK